MARISPLISQQLSHGEKSISEAITNQRNLHGREISSTTEEISVINNNPPLPEGKQSARTRYIDDQNEEEEYITAIEEEKYRHEWSLNLRLQRFKNILAHEAMDVDWAKFSLHTISSIILVRHKYLPS